MFGIRYLQSSPTTYVIRYKKGRIVKEGAGLSFVYFKPGSTIVRISLATQDVPFVFEQQTSDFQDVTIQGNLTYRIVAPSELAKQLDYSVDARGRYTSDDPDNLQERLVRLAQSQTQVFAHSRPLAEVLQASKELARELLSSTEVSSVFTKLGLQLEEAVILSVKATPEMATAMQAEAREMLLQKADEAIHQRRNIALELEREIKENELKTERIVQEKQREVREAELEANVAIEKGRAELVEQKSANDAKEAEIQIQTLKETLQAMKTVDWRTLAAGFGGTDSKQLIAMAFGELAQNARKIGRLDISPSLIQQLLDDKQTEAD